MEILTKWLEKRGVKDIAKLSDDDKEVYERYKTTLKGREVTLEDIKIFIAQQVGLIEARWRDYETSQEKKNELLPYYTCYKTLLAAINAPEVEREALEKYLISQI